MHIAVNTRLLLPNKLDGIGWFSHEVLSRLTKELDDWKFTFLFDRPFSDEFIYGPNVEGVVLYPPTRHPLLYRAYFQRSVPHKLGAIQPDLFFSPDGFLSTRTSVKQVPVIHDLNFEHRPQDLPRSYRNYYRSFFPKFAQKAHHIITVSEYSKQDISKTYGVDASKISVAYNGYNPAYKPLSEEQKRSARNEFSQGKPYFIFVGNFSHRKNIHGIIKSYDHYRSSGGQSKLLLVGNSLWRYHEMDEAIGSSPYRSDILLPGRLGIEKLTMAMGGAQALIFPSYFEGFGIPIVEAYAAGIPVITSDRTALPEVAGSGALVSDPDDHSKISSNMIKIESDDNQRITLIENGKERISDISWEHTANKVKEALFISLNLH